MATVMLRLESTKATSVVFGAPSCVYRSTYLENILNRYVTHIVLDDDVSILYEWTQQAQPLSRKGFTVAFEVDQERIACFRIHGSVVNDLCISASDTQIIPRLNNETLFKLVEPAASAASEFMEAAQKFVWNR